MSLLDQIPGLAEAMEEERVNRDLALMDTVPICGLPCRQISLRTLILLRQCGNTFVLGGIPSPEEVAVYLWVHSLGYCLDQRRRIRWIKRNVRPLIRSGRFQLCVTQINSHLRRAFQDAMGQNGDDGKEYVNPGASVIDFLASEYGWTDDWIMNLPIARVFLYQRAARMRYNPRVPMFNASDRIISEHLQKRMQGN